MVDEETVAVVDLEVDLGIGRRPVDLDEPVLPAAVQEVADAIRVHPLTEGRRLDLVQPGRCEVIRRIAERRRVVRMTGELREVHVAGDEDNARDPELSDQPEEPLPLERRIAPALPLLVDVVVLDHLDAAADDPDRGRLEETLAQPCPLHLAEDLPAGVLAGVVPGVEVVAVVQQDHLDGSAFGAERASRIHARLIPARIVSSRPPEAEELGLRGVAVRPPPVRVVRAEIVIVPGRHHLGRRGKLLEAVVRCELVVDRPHRRHVSRVRVDVVAEPDHQVGIVRHDVGEGVAAWGVPEARPDRDPERLIRCPRRRRRWLRADGRKRLDGPGRPRAREPGHAPSRRRAVRRVARQARAAAADHERDQGGPRKTHPTLSVDVRAGHLRRNRCRRHLAQCPERR